ncbi:MAG: hypothetical protein ACLPJH_06090 [Myxococcaceae bacterium]
MSDPVPAVDAAATALLRSSAALRPAHPPAIWAAMVRQAQWKSWALVLAFALCALEGLVMLKLARKEPDIVLIAPDGRSTYVTRSVAGDALLRFLDEQRQQPSDVTIFHFTRDFLRHFFATDSLAYEASFREALGMLSVGFGQRVAREAAASKLLEAVRGSRARASLVFESLDFVERTKDAVHLRAVLLRRTERLPEGTLLGVDKLEVDLYESVVPRSAAHPDGLVIGQFTSRSEKVDPAGASSPPPTEPSAHAP